MKKLLIVTAVTGLTCLGMAGKAQDDKKVKSDKEYKESQEIIIRKKGDKDAKITVEISGDKVTINGKPLAEFKDDEVTINRRNIIVRDRMGRDVYTIAPDAFDGFSGFWGDDKAEKRAFLGVTTEKTDEGAKITDVTNESAADKAGLKEGDVITKLGDKKIDGPESLYDAVSGQKPKDEVKLSYKRNGKENTAKVTLGERKSIGAMTYSFSGPDGLARSYTVPRAYTIPKVPELNNWNWNDRSFGNGYSFSMAPRQQKLGIRIQDTEDGKGVKVLDVEADSPADKAGLKKDDVITEIGGEKVENTDEARNQLHENADKSTYSIKANRNGSAMNFDIKIPKKLKTANL